MPAKLINVVLYQCAWFACIFGAAKGQPWLGLGISFIVLAWHLSQAPLVKNEVYLLLSTLVIGFVFDQGLLTAQLIDYKSHGWSDALVPMWILALWLTFATLLNVSLRWMRPHLMYAVLFGLVGGPLAYYAAVGLNAITILDQRAYWILALGWGVVTPVLILLSQRFDGYNPMPVATKMKASL
jgi:hypothetical protein